MKITTVRLPVQLYEKLRKRSYDTRKSMNQIILEALKKELEEVSV